MKKVIVAVLSLALASPAALADGVHLAPGKPAGVRQAQLDMSTTISVLAGAAIIAVIVAVSTSGNTTPAVTTSSAVGSP